MNTHDDTTLALANRLRHEAWTERPAFSPALHATILARLQQERAIRRRWRAPARRWAVAAAMLLIAMVLTIRQRTHPSLARKSDPIPTRVQPPTNAIEITSAQPLLASSIEINPIVSVCLVFPSIRVRLPILSGSNDTLPEAPPSLQMIADDGPQRLLDGINTPMLQSENAVLEQVPPSLRLIAGIIAQYHP